MVDLTSSIIDFDIQQYFLNWPAFFTIQDNRKTRAMQLKYWADLLHSFFLKNLIFKSNTSELWSGKYSIFEYNKGEKKLSKEEIMLIMNELFCEGKIEWTQEIQKDVFIVFKYSIYEISDAIYNWAIKCGKIGSIETIKWIIEGDDTDKNEKFYGLPEELIIKSINVLEKCGKAQIFEVEKNRFGVKFT